jgi:hypothetical protein
MFCSATHCQLIFLDSTAITVHYVVLWVYRTCPINKNTSFDPDEVLVGSSRQLIVAILLDMLLLSRRQNNDPSLKNRMLQGLLQLFYCYSSTLAFHFWQNSHYQNCYAQRHTVPGHKIWQMCCNKHFKTWRQNTWLNVVL